MCNLTIINLFTEKAWDGFIKYENYVLIDKNVLKYSYGKVSFLIILKDIETNIFYKVIYTTVYKSYCDFKITINKIVQVEPEVSNNTVWRTGEEILDDIIKSIK